MEKRNGSETSKIGGKMIMIWKFLFILGCLLGLFCAVVVALFFTNLVFKFEEALDKYLKEPK